MDSKKSSRPRGDLTVFTAFVFAVLIFAVFVFTVFVSAVFVSAVFVFTLGLERPALAQGLAIRAEGERWLRVDAAHFTLFSNAPEAATTHLATNLERMQQALAELAPTTTQSAAAPLVFFWFQDEDSYRPYRVTKTPSTEDSSPLDVGFVVPHAQGVYGVIRNSPEGNSVQYFYKQYILYLLHVHLPHLPEWLRQGIAEFYATFELVADEVQIGRFNPSHVKWFSSHASAPIPLPQLFRFQPGLSLEPDMLLFRAQSWALVHYLMVENLELKPGLVAYAQQTGGGLPHDLAFSQAFSLDEATLQQQLVSYIRGDAFKYLRGKIQNRPVELQVRALAPAETLYHLGDLIHHVLPAQREAAKAHFERALALAPDHGPTWSSMGQLAEVEERWDDARAAYACAVVALPADPWVHYLYGKSLLQPFKGRRPAEAELAQVGVALAALQLATTRQPDLAEAWVHLGYAHELSNPPSAAAIPAFEHALELLPPSRTDVVLSLILSYARVGNRQRVDALTAQLRAANADAATLVRAREIQLKLDYQVANQLVRQRELDDAILIYLQILEETQDPALRQLATDQLAKADGAANSLRFGRRYRTAVELLQAQQLDALVPLLAELQAQARSERQKDAAQRLAVKIEEVKRHRDRAAPGPPDG